jgi:hypothetical protein
MTPMSLFLNSALSRTVIGKSSFLHPRRLKILRRVWAGLEGQKKIWPIAYQITQKTSEFRCKL